MDSTSFVPSSDRFGATVGSLRRCVACGHAALADLPAEELFEGAYADAADAVSLAEEPGQVATARRDLQRLARHVEPGALLDVGCWTGSFLVAAAQEGWVAEGLEPSAWACARAVERGCTVRQATLADVELAPEHYRVIVATDVIEHLLDPAAAVDALWRALEPDGVLFVTVPDAGSVVARALGHRWWSVLPMHVQYFTRRSMSVLLERHGLVVEDVTTHPKVFSLGYYADRVSAFVPLAGPVVGKAVRSAHLDRRVVAPDFHDRMAVAARKVRRDGRTPA